MKKYCLDGEIAEFDYHDGSGFWSFCGPKSLKAFLAELKTGEKAEIEINSPGGSVICGVEMANAIKNSGAHLVAHVTGMAASMASVVACACDEIVMEEASFMMIHDPWTELAGNAAELRKEADILDQMKAMIMGFYRGKFAKRTDEELAQLMSATTYMTANECVEAGLACSVVSSGLRYAAKLTARDMAKAPEAARAFFQTAAMPDDVKAAIDAARADALANAGSPAASSQSETGAATAATQTEPTAPTAAAQAPKAEPPSEPVASQGKDTKPADDWEARYKGASKKLNEYQARIAELEKKVADAAVETVDYGTVVEERDALKAHVAELEKDFNGKLEKGEKDLADANAKISDLSAKLEKSEKDLAECGQQLDHMKQTRDLLTGGVLTPTEGSDYKAKMAAATTPEERERLRNLKKAKKIK